MITMRDVMVWYESLDSDVRDEFNKEFGNEGIPDREWKYMKWLLNKKFKPKSKQKDMAQVEKKDGLLQVEVTPEISVIWVEASRNIKIIRNGKVEYSAVTETNYTVIEFYHFIENVKNNIDVKDPNV